MEKENSLHFESYEEAADWFETYDMADYEEVLKPVEFHVDLRKDRNWVELEHFLAQKIRVVAKEKGVSNRSLVNEWLSEKVSQP